MSEPRQDGLFETLKTVALAVVIAIVVRTVGYEPFNIPSGSMIPTLLVGDYLFVSKFSYGYSRYSLPFGLPLIPGRILGSDPERGDVVVFKTPQDNATDFIKRIVGLPGDTIQVKGGILHINGKAVERRRLDDALIETDLGSYARFQVYEETLPNGKTHLIMENGDNRVGDNTPEFRVPQGQFFAMGDNRDNSTDSRFKTVGFIPRVNLVGRAEFLFFSIEGGEFWQFWNWPTTVRTDRLFNGIE
ncbi:MAG: signal peptidase I [Magnetovibrionaceae bacterium]